MSCTTPIADVIERLEAALDPARLELGRQRQAAVWRGATPDYLPLLLGHTPLQAGGRHYNRRWMLSEHQLTCGTPTADLETYPHDTLIELFRDPEKMLYEQLWEMISWARSESDAQLSVRNGFLVWALASAFGVEPQFDHTQMPWGDNHLPKAALADLAISGMEHRGQLPESLRFVEYFNEHLPAHVRQYVPDLSGPLALANYLFGNDWFWTDFHDDPDFIEAALDFCADVHTHMGRVYKDAVGERDGDDSYHGSLCMAGGGVKVVDDSNVNLAPQQWRAFVMPRLARCFAEFGSGWYHSCGHYPEKLDMLLEIPCLRAINFGNPEMWDLDNAVRRITAADKVYYGTWVRKAGESLESCFRRALKAAGPERKGMIIMLSEPEPGEMLPPPGEIMALWQRLQDAG